MLAPTLTFAFAPYRLSGTVYGVLLNHAPALQALGAAVNDAPYKAPPKAPVLYVKPRNTLAAPGSTCELPADVDALQIGANLGISAKTVESHLTRIFERVHVASRTELALLAVREGWVETV